MRQSVRSGLAAALVAALAAHADAQQPPAGKAQPKAPAAKAAPAQAPAGAGAATAKAATPPARPAILDQVLATVNGENITRGELVQYLSQYALPPGAVSNEEKYKVGIDGLINFHLANQFITKQNPPVSEKEIDAEFNSLAEALKKNGQDITVELAANGMTVAQVRDDMKKRLRWSNYIKNVATDPVLKKYVDDNKDVFNRTLVQASHIVLRADAGAAPAEKAKVRQRLLDIKKEIDGNKISFADAANKYSEDEGNKVSPSGGDLGYFTRKGQLDPSFCAAAFALKKGVVSEPVETPFGFHLIQVTDRKEGTPVNFEQNKPAILAEYAADLQERIVTEQLKTAKVDIKPMPGDLFRAPEPTQGPAPDPAAPKAAAPAGAAPKAATPKAAPPR